MRTLIAAIFLVTTLIASAATQQKPDAAQLERLLTALEAQRNQALTQQAYAEAARAALAEELAKAQTKIKELEAKTEEKK